MNGINRFSGKSLTGLEHLRQSIIDIITTPIGTRVMRREYGSKVPELIDAPMNSSTIMYLYAAIAEALDKWEPRLLLKRIELVDVTETGKCSLVITGDYLPDGVAVKIDGIIV